MSKTLQIYFMLTLSWVHLHRWQYDSPGPYFLCCTHAVTNSHRLNSWLVAFCYLSFSTVQFISEMQAWFLFEKNFFMRLVFQAILRQFHDGLNSCSPETLLKVGNSYPDMMQQEKALDGYIELHKRDQVFCFPNLFHLYLNHPPANLRSFTI